MNEELEDHLYLETLARMEIIIKIAALLHTDRQHVALAMLAAEVHEVADTVAYK